MQRTRVRWGRVGGLLAAVGVALTVAASSAQAGGADPHPQRHVTHRAAPRHYLVRPGDTLWTIASKLAGPSADPRPTVDAIVRANHLGSSLAVGTLLVVPR